MKEGSSLRRIIHEECCVTSLEMKPPTCFHFLVEAGYVSDWRSDSIHIEASRNPVRRTKDAKDLLPREKQKASKHLDT